MATQFTKDMNIITNFLKDMDIIAKLDDQPNDVGGLTAAELKAKFDEGGKAIQEYINGTLIPEVIGIDATEQSRQEAETARVTAENNRQLEENARYMNEETRKQNEANRVLAEKEREQQEQARQEAEQARVDTTNGIVAQATAQAQAASQSASAAAGSASAAQQSASSSQQSASNASSSASAAETSAKTSESWAVGGTGTRAGEDTNNAKYWASVAAGAAGGGVTTFNGRSGAVVPQAGDYTAEMVGATTKSYVDGLVGNINTLLDQINGEVV